MSKDSQKTLACFGLKRIRPDGSGDEKDKSKTDEQKSKHMFLIDLKYLRVRQRNGTESNFLIDFDIHFLGTSSRSKIDQEHVEIPSASSSKSKLHVESDKGKNKQFFTRFQLDFLISNVAMFKSV